MTNKLTRAFTTDVTPPNRKGALFTLRMSIVIFAVISFLAILTVVRGNTQWLTIASAVMLGVVVVINALTLRRYPKTGTQ